MIELIQMIDAAMLISWSEIVGAVILILLAWKYMFVPVIYIIKQLKGD